MLLKEIFKFSNGKATKLFTIGNNPVYGSTGIIGYTDKVLISGENTLIARVGSCGYCQYVTGQYWVSDNTIIATTKNGFIPKYGFYLLLMQNLQRLRIGTTQPLLTISILNSIDVKVHSFSEQQHIVNTIGTIDDLIENKLKIIAKIKEFRRVIFLNYQSNCNKKINLSDVVDFENGAQPPKSQHIYEKRNGYIRFIQNRDYNSDSHITFIPISRKNHICDEHDIMMDKYGEAGAIRYGIAGAYNVALLKIITKNKHLKEWIRDYLSQPEIKENLFLSSQASTRPSLNESTFISLKLPLMDDSLLFEYENSMNSLLNVELLIKKEILLLKKSKDRLLEKYF